MKRITDLCFKGADTFVVCFMLSLFALRGIHLNIVLVFVSSLLFTIIIMFIERLP